MSATKLGLLVCTTLCSHAHCIRETRPFSKSVRAEAEFQVRRLAESDLFALWCGNNELELLNGADLAKRKQRTAYDAIFRRILPEASRRTTASRPIGARSPSQSDRPRPERSRAKRNTHYWDVWHC